MTTVIANAVVGALIGLPFAALVGSIAIAVASVIGSLAGIRRCAPSAWWNQLAIPGDLRRAIRLNRLRHFRSLSGRATVAGGALGSVGHPMLASWRHHTRRPRQPFVARSERGYFGRLRGWRSIAVTHREASV